MHNLAYAPEKRNHIDAYRILEPAFRPLCTSAPITAAGAHLQRRYRVPASIADLVASLAGLGEREARQ
jgi:hypothetical protein